MDWKVPFINLSAQYEEFKIEFDEAFSRVMKCGSFILRADVTDFENEMAKRLGVKYVIGVNSGTDALYLSIRALDINLDDEVITVAHTFVATIAAITHVGAKPVLVDIGEDYNMLCHKIEEKITKNTKAIIPVHLNGRMCDMEKIKSLAIKHNLFVIEDSAQALGAKFNQKRAGSIGDVGCFSLHPMKILSVPGDGGFISTNNDYLNKKIRKLRDHGQTTKTDISMFGFNSRLDNLHAALAAIKLKSFDVGIKKRREIADFYDKKLSDLPITLPCPPSSGTYYDVYNSYVIGCERRDTLVEHMINKKVEVFVHMGVPLYEHKKLSLDGAGLNNNNYISSRIVSLPIYPEMSEDNMNYVVESIRGFFK